MNVTALACTSIATLGLIAAATLVPARSVTAGPLTPPGGAVSGTYKTLAEVEPRIAINQANTPGDANSICRINQPGSYYLTANLIGTAGKRGIEIVASNVTIDLGGFRVVGSAGSLEGIVLEGSAGNVAVRNGTVEGWGQGGVYFGQFSHASVVEGIRAVGNAGVGITVGDTSIVAECLAMGNTHHGITTWTASTVRHCVSQDNGSDGFFLGDGSTMSDSAAQSNDEGGVVSNGDCVIDRVTSTLNGADGFWVSGGTIISRCNSSSNGEEGVHAFHSIIEHCTIRDNGENGIAVEHRSTVRFNLCANNGLAAGGGAGVWVFGGDSRIESNHCIGQDRGIHVVGTSNLVIRNTCGGNAINWTIGANNQYGPIIDRSGVSTPAVNGSFANISTLGTSDPHANFTY